MLTSAHLQEIRDHLERARNPLFFFDDDCDGLVSFLLLKKKYKKGRGICVKAAPHEYDIYLRKIQEYHPDRVFFLDKAVIPQEFFDQISIPSVWIDHHAPVERTNVFYYNPMMHKKKDNRPTSYWCYQVTRENLWLAMIGIIADWHVPEFVQHFEYKDLLEGKKTPPEILFESKFGKLVKIFEFLMKGSTTEVRKYVNILEKIENPLEILEQTTPRGKYLYKQFETVNKDYQTILKKALATKHDKDLFLFIYPSTKNSFTKVLSNEALHSINAKLIIVGREKDDDVRLSLRSKNVKVLPLLQEALKSVEGYGGGHEYACGANIKKKDFEIFISILREQLQKSSK